MRLSCRAYSFPFLMASCTPASVHKLLKAFRQSIGIGSSGPISGSAATTSANLCDKVRCVKSGSRVEVTHNIALFGKVNFLLLHRTKHDLEGM